MTGALHRLVRNPRCSRGVLLAALFVAPSLVGAQSTDASISGSVRDTTGIALSGSVVTVRNLSTGGEWSVRSNTAGRFALLQLPLGGPYSVVARHIGYRSESRSGYHLRLGERAMIDLVLTPVSTVLEPVIVDGSADERRSTSAGASFRVGGDAIVAIPAVNRNFTDLAALAPTTGVQGSLLGQRWTSTDIRIDGAQARNLLRAGEFGAGPFTLSLEAIREFEVSSSSYDVAQGRQGGGAIRAATRAGTNTWQGSAFSYYRGGGLSAPEDFQARTRAERQFNALQWGGSIGGPVVRDRLHVFAAVDRWNSSEPLFSGVVRTASEELSSGVARDSLTRLVRILGERYALDTTRTQLGRLDRQPVASTFFLRVDARLSARHQLTLTHDENHWDSPLAGGVDQPITLLDGRSDYRTREQQSLLTLQSTSRHGLHNTLKLGVSSSARTLTPNSSAPRGFVRIQSNLPNGTRGDVRVQFGGNRLAPDASREHQVQLIDLVYLQRGNVLWTLGTDHSLAVLKTYIAEAQAGLFEFNSLADLEALRPFRYSRTLPLGDATPATRQHVLESAVFSQAEWRPNERVTATFGLRWDATAFLEGAPRNARVEAASGVRTDRRPIDLVQLQPRAELIWSLDDNGTHVLRLGAGRFSAPAPYYLQHNQLLNDGTRIVDITLTGASIPTPDYAAFRRDPLRIPGLPPGADPPPPYVNVIGPDFQMPSVWKGSASLRRRLGARSGVTGTILYTRTTGNYMYLDRNLRSTPAFTLGSERDRPVFVPASTIDAQGRTLHANALATPTLGRVLELRHAGEGRQRAVVVEAAMNPGREATLTTSYTYNRATDNSTFGCCLARTATSLTAVPGDPRDLSAGWGPSDTDFRHKIIVAGAVPLAWGVKLGGRYVGSNGRAFSAVVNGDINGDESASNDLAFVFDPDDPATPPHIASAMQRLLANPRNVARDYLRRNLGRIATRNGVFAPWSQRVDLRLTRMVRTKGRSYAEIGLDMFNMANLLNRRWGAEYLLPVGISSQNPVVQRVPLLNVVGFDQATRRYVYSVNENFGLLQKGGVPYQLQLSLRYGF